jgi:16S rRNA (adenine1518-N6/adenine1519-N6)-dimethyltransferase
MSAACCRRSKPRSKWLYETGDAATRVSHRPRKRFGQNFLIDQQVIDRIVATINPRPDEPLVEIGPGQGALTQPLVALGADLHVIEIDRDLAASLPAQIPGLDPSRIHVGDALKVDLPALLSSPPGGRAIRVVGNLPYNISTPLLVHLLNFADSIRDMHFMLQQEVVDRLAASPGGRDYGRLSLMCQYHCTVTPLFTVPPGAFRPVPKVESGFLRLVPHERPPVTIPDYPTFERVVAQAFSQRRKTLRNSLKPMMTAEMIESAGIDPTLRAEALGLEDYAALTRIVAH